MVIHHSSFTKNIGSLMNDEFGENFVPNFDLNSSLFHQFFTIFTPNSVPRFVRFMFELMFVRHENQT